VISPVKNGPSDKAGIKSGDRILSANGVPLFGKKASREKLYTNLKGEANTEVKITVYRKSNHKRLNFTVIRNTVSIKSVDVAMLINKQTGYIKINRFAETTYEEFKQGLHQIIKAGAHSLVLDLRDNGGGFMEEAILIADEFLPEKKLIVFTKDKKATIKKTFATDVGSFETGKVVVLLNENSASASEILAGAIQDNDRGLIIGRRSFGKGLVQREVGFEDGSSVRLTIARYYTPTGRSIQKPYKSGSEAYMSEFVNRFHNGEMYTKDSIKIADTLKFKTPRGRIVYGGGGIFPDIFVPSETSQGNEIIPMIMQSGLLTNFVFKTIDKDRKYFEKFSFPALLKEIETNKNYFNSFEAQLKQGNNLIDLTPDKKYIIKYLQAEFSHQLFNENKYYSVLLSHDPMIKRTLLLKGFK